jgi:hypothetical protein
MRGTPFTPEETEIAIRGLAQSMATKELIIRHKDEYDELTEKHIKNIKD